jgi:hypothetical protein
MVGLVFGSNYSYGGRISSGDGYRLANASLTALTRSAAANMLDDGITSLSTIMATNAARKSGYGYNYSKLVDILV